MFFAVVAFRLAAIFSPPSCIWATPYLTNEKEV
jgi:hypothetical protein